MTLKLTLFSQEKEDFVREILVDSDATFAELHQLILDDCNYREHQKQRFLICDEDWHIGGRICLQEDDDIGYDEDVNLMKDTRLGDFLEDEGQRVAYVFDPEGKRFFLMELTENVFGKKAPKAVVNRGHGLPPQQEILSTELPAEEGRSPEPMPLSDEEDSDEREDTFYGDEGFEAEELDPDSYEIDE